MAQLAKMDRAPTGKPQKEACNDGCMSLFVCFSSCEQLSVLVKKLRRMSLFG